MKSRSCCEKKSELGDRFRVGSFQKIICCGKIFLMVQTMSGCPESQKKRGIPFLRWAKWSAQWPVLVMMNTLYICCHWRMDLGLWIVKLGDVKMVGKSRKAKLAREIRFKLMGNVIPAGRFWGRHYAISEDEDSGRSLRIKLLGWLSGKKRKWHQYFNGLGLEFGQQGVIIILDNAHPKVDWNMISILKNREYNQQKKNHNQLYPTEKFSWMEWHRITRECYG